MTKQSKYCPACTKKLTAHYQTIYTCGNPDCIFHHAILSEEQWDYIIHLDNYIKDTDPQEV